MLLWPPFASGDQSKMAACMDGLAALVTAAAPAANVFGWPVESIQPPAVVVGYPVSWDFDMVMNRAADEVVYPLWFVVGRSSTKEARNALSDILSDTGSIKDIIDGQHTFGVFDVSVRVTGAEVTELQVAGVPYLAAKFDCEVIG